MDITDFNIPLPKIKSLLNDLVDDIKLFEIPINEVRDELFDLMDQKKELVDKHNKIKYIYEYRLYSHTNQKIATHMPIHQVTRSKENISSEASSKDDGKTYDSFFNEDIELRNHINKKRQVMKHQQQFLNDKRKHMEDALRLLLEHKKANST